MNANKSIITNKQYVSYDRTSRYAPFPYYYHRLDDKYFYGTTSYLKNDTPHSLYTVAKRDTLDSLALKFYGNPTYYWVLCSFNHIQDPYTKLKEGQVIKVPTLSSIEFENFESRRWFIMADTQKLHVSLISAPNQVESPFVIVKIGNATFGSCTQKKKSVNGLFQVDFPNFIDSLEITKING